MSGAATIAAVAAVASVGVAAYSTIEQKKANARAREQQEEAINNQRIAQEQQQQQAEQQMAQQQAQASQEMAAATQSFQATQAQFEKQNTLQQNQLKTAEESSNKYSAKRPNSTAMLAATEQAAKSGASGTMLTGPQGIDPNALSLSKNTLLGS